MSATTRGARHLLVALAAAALVAGMCNIAPVAAAEPPTSGSPAQILDRDLRGEEAIRALGDRLPAVAAQNELTPAAFRAALRRDSMLWVSRTGQLLFVDELQLGPEPADTASELLASATMPPGTDVFALHSRPGADRVVVLDFDGHDARGTAWGSSPRQNAAPYSQDGDNSTFNEAEQTAIHSVWQRVAEDYAPFAVDVTTEDPGHGPGSTGHESIRRDSAGDTRYGTRVVITPTQAYSCSCGGVAYVGVFDAIGADHDVYQPAWVFTSGVGTGAKNIAEAASHEAGHNLGLSHDGTATSGYYTGHGDWAPIMGVGYYQPVSQWSQGEYSGANNREDDFTVAATNGAPLAPDDQTGPVELLDGVTVHGTIGPGGDVDSFTLTTDGNPVQLTARPAAVSPNLDLRMRVVSGSTTLHTIDAPLVLSDSNDVSDGLDAIAELTLTAGSYTILLDGTGWGDPLSSGYTTYGSVGRYTLTRTAGGGGSDPEPPPPPATAPAAPSALVATAEGSGVRLTWTDNSADELGFEVQREFQHRNGSFRGTTTIVVDGRDVTTTTDSPGSGTFQYRVRAVNGELASAYTAWVEIAVSGGSGGGGGGKGKPTKAR